MCRICDKAETDANGLLEQEISKHEHFNYTLYSYVFNQTIEREKTNMHKDEKGNIVRNHLLLCEYVRQCTPNAVVHAWQPAKWLN